MSNSIIDPLLPVLKDIMTTVTNLIAIRSFSDKQSDVVSSIEAVNTALEKAVIISRNTLERLWINPDLPKQKTHSLPFTNISGAVRVMEYNWLHIQLNTLLPHCRFQTPQYLSDTINRLLDHYVATKGSIPRYDNALLIIDEHCDIQHRSVYDQDNKSWKSVSNALKGRVFPDDDQFTLGIALVSKQTPKMMCNIYVIDANDAGEFFNMRSSGCL